MCPEPDAHATRMAVLGARACPELPPTTRRWFLSAARRYTARAAGYLTRQMSR
jgi:hypothetical protein